MAYGESFSTSCRVGNITNGQQNRKMVERELDLVRKIFSNDEELYKLCQEKGIAYIVKQYGLSYQAVAIVINSYQKLLASQHKASKKKPQSPIVDRLFPKNEIVTDIKKRKDSEKIIVFYADGKFKLYDKRQYKLIKNSIFHYGKHIVDVVENNFLSNQDRKRVEKANKEDQMETLNGIIKRKKDLLLEEKELYLKWKFYFENQELIESIHQYKTSAELKMLLNYRNLIFQKINSPKYTYKEAETELTIASQMYQQIQENSDILLASFRKIK